MTRTHRIPPLTRPIWALGLLVVLLIGSAISPSARALDTRERVLRLESLEIAGNWKTREAVIRHLAELAPGDPLNADSVGRVRERLLASGYFGEVEISTRPGLERGRVVMRVSLVERHLPYLDTGFGYRDPEGWYLTLIGLRSENPFGLGGRVRAGLQLGFRSAGGDVDLRLPLRSDGLLDLRLHLRGVDEQLLWYENEPGWKGLYDEHRLDLKRQEAELGCIWRPREGFRLELGVAARSALPGEAGENRDTNEEVPPYRLPTLFREEAGRQELHGLTLGLRLGDGGMDGRPGHSLHLRGRWVDPALGGDRGYSRWTLALRSTTRFASGHGIALGLRAGLVGAAAPYYERFRLGGSYSVRGFRDHGLSPPEGHDALVTAAGEYRFPVLNRAGGGTRLSGLVFVDAGRGWLENLPTLAEPDIDYERLQLGAGYGLRLHLPWIGIIGFDVGLPVTAGITGEPVWYYLTLGQTF